MMKTFIRKIAILAAIIWAISAVLYFFSKKNMLTDYTAKVFVEKYTLAPQVMKHEVCEERRAVYQLILKNKGKHFQNLIIGSSRVMQFGAHTGFDNALNTGVAGATLKDLEYIVSLIRQNSITCDTVIFDFNPWYALSETDERYRQFETGYRVKSAFLDIVKLDYNEDDLRSLRSTSTVNYYPASQAAINNPGNFIRFPDGSIKQKVLDVKSRQKRIDQFCKEFYQMKTFTSFDDDAVSDFFRFVNDAFGKTPKVIMFTPFHPKLFLENKTDIRVENILRVEKRFKDLAAGMNTGLITVSGSFNPDSADCKVNEAEFVDGFHISETAIKRLFGSRHVAVPSGL